MVEYKWLSRSEAAREYQGKLTNRRDRVTPTDLTRREKTMAVLEKMKQEAKHGWIFADVFELYNAVLLMRESEEPWEYYIVDFASISKSKTDVDKAEIIEEQLNKIGNDGWQYLYALYDNDPVPRIDLLFVRKVPEVDDKAELIETPEVKPKSKAKK